MNWIKNFIKLLIPILIIGGSVEFGSYLIWDKFLAPRKSNGVFLVKKIIGTQNVADSKRIVSNPYTLYWNNPLFKDEYGRQYDDLGYRSEPYNQKPNELRVLALGGSTNNSYPYTKNRDKIWTSLLSKSLSKELNRPVHVFNAGLPYGTSAELMVHYLLNGKHLNPHIVIFHEGGNDVAPLLFPGYKTDYSHLRQSNNGLPRPHEKAILLKSYTARVIYSAWLKQQGVYQAQPAPFETLDAKEATKRVIENSSNAFRSNVSVIVNEAIADKSKVLLVGFLQAKKENISKNRPDLAGLESAFVEGVKKHDNIMLNVAEKYGQKFLKLDQSKFNDNWFFDNCHLNEAGEAEKARQIHEAIISILRN